MSLTSDNLYITPDTEETWKQFKISQKSDSLGTQGVKFPENPLEITGPDMLEKIYKILNTSNNLLSGEFTNFSDGAIEEVMGKNLFIFFKRALPE